MKKAKEKATAKVNQVLQQAKQSVEVLRMIEKEAMNRANGEFKKQLRKLGFVSQTEYRELEKRVESLEKKVSAS